MSHDEYLLDGEADLVVVHEPCAQIVGRYERPVDLGTVVGDAQDHECRQVE
jgi:hypothetical protein